MVIKIIVVLILWALAVMNTELLIRWNHFAVSDGSQSQWQFGQVRCRRVNREVWTNYFIDSTYVPRCAPPN